MTRPISNFSDDLLWGVSVFCVVSCLVLLFGALLVYLMQDLAVQLDGIGTGPSLAGGIVLMIMWILELSLSILLYTFYCLVSSTRL